METGRMKSYYIFVGRGADFFSNVLAYYVVMMSHAIDRYSP